MPLDLELLAGLPYRPINPKSYWPAIGLIGCGGISKHHLIAYASAGYHVKALCDLRLEAAQSRRAEYFPDATVCDDYREMLRDDDIQVVDIVTHPPGRPALIEAALLAGKHVLSQKPFVIDLDEGERLVELAERQGCYLAVNQNGRWAPHFSYSRLVAQTGIIGEIFGAHLGCYWDHTWVAGTEFENVKHLILYDYAIHWFDILRCFLPGRATRVFASTCRAPGQRLAPALLAQAAVEFEAGQATLAFDAALPHGSHDSTFLSGTKGCLHSFGVDIQQQEVHVSTASGRWSPKLQGSWFSDGFHGTMGELLCAIEDKRECTISAADNLQSLALCFAAIHSAETGQSVVPGTVRRMPA
jgi:predicted dehydrogenase